MRAWKRFSAYLPRIDLTISREPQLAGAHGLRGNLKPLEPLVSRALRPESTRVFYHRAEGSASRRFEPPNRPPDRGARPRATASGVIRMPVVDRLVGYDKRT